MERHGFIRDMMEVKALILYITARAKYPATVLEIYDLCYQDECLSYFDVCTAVPELVQSGHLQELETGQYVITDKGRADGAETENSVAYSVRQRAGEAVEEFNRQTRRSGFVKAQVLPADNGYTVQMSLSDELGPLMRLEMSAPGKQTAQRIARSFEEKAERLYNLNMKALLDDENI